MSARACQNKSAFKREEGGGREVKLKEAKGQRQRRLICETGAMEGYLKDISQRVGAGEKERQRGRGVGGESREGRRRKKYGRARTQ